MVTLSYVKPVRIYSSILHRIISTVFQKYIKKKNHLVCVIIVDAACFNRLPDIYEGDCERKCEDWAREGYCDKDWKEVRHCMGVGKIKDSCRLSCNNCGRHLRYLQYTKKIVSNSKNRNLF